MPLEGALRCLRIWKKHVCVDRALECFQTPEVGARVPASGRIEGIGVSQVLLTHIWDLCKCILGELCTVLTARNNCQHLQLQFESLTEFCTCIGRWRFQIAARHFCLWHIQLTSLWYRQTNEADGVETCVLTTCSEDS